MRVVQAGFVAMVAVLILACGGGSGACIGKSELGGRYDYCHDDYTQEECSAVSDSTFSSNSCGSLGYKKVCADDPSNTYRMSCP